MRDPRESERERVEGVKSDDEDAGNFSFFLERRQGEWGGSPWLSCVCVLCERE